MTVTPERSTYTPPGRLGDESSGPRTDPRFSPAMVEALATFGLDEVAAAPPVSASDDLPTVLAAVGASHDGFQGSTTPSPWTCPRTATTSRLRPRRSSGSTATRSRCTSSARRGGGRAARPGLHARRRHDDPHHRQPGPPPLVHGSRARAGSVVVMVDFRNAWTAEGHHPFRPGSRTASRPCCGSTSTGSRWACPASSCRESREKGNLAIAHDTAGEATRPPRRVDGVYASIPYISGGYAWDHERRLTELPSLVENDGYFIENGGMALLVRAYDPTGEHAEDPIAWPYFASEDELRGLPPFVVAVNELDRCATRASPSREGWRGRAWTWRLASTSGSCTRPTSSSGTGCRPLWSRPCATWPGSPPTGRAFRAP
uniref:Esterase n=1 Tax=Bacillus subtilis TaxID=1423 RepID=Q45559_BACIU|nr:esterase [Bacillus subtilis]